MIIFILEKGLDNIHSRFFLKRPLGIEGNLHNLRKKYLQKTNKQLYLMKKY